MTAAKVSSWKEYVNTILLSVVSYLIVDLHQSFKHVANDVEELKITVGKHDYILNLKQGSENEKGKTIGHKLEAILPYHDKKYYTLSKKDEKSDKS